MSTGRYSRLDRALHDVAFAGSWMQLALADVEDSVFSRSLAEVSIQKPVFITSLPRAGTTLLLELMASVPAFASHSYRLMPFVLCPLLWDHLSKPFRRETSLHERAHGDGIKIGFDSPEAFEEVVWLAFWKRKYSAGHIEVWQSTDRDDEFERFLRQHMRKIVRIRRDAVGGSPLLRYCSKNNANVARLSLLPELFPDCRIVIPFRNPRDHVGSLVRQHRRFTEIHAQDRFAFRYMRWLGHFEFGELLRPIDFDGWTADVAAEFGAADYWLSYWVAAYEAVLRTAGACVCFFDYDDACERPAPALEALGRWLELEPVTDLTAQAPRFGAPPRYTELVLDDHGLEARADRVFDSLRARSLKAV